LHRVGALFANWVSRHTDLSSQDDLFKGRFKNMLLTVSSVVIQAYLGPALFSLLGPAAPVAAGAIMP
jgi:hypothetical protein